MPRRSALLALALTLSSLLAHADDASKMSKVQEFFEVAKLDQLSTQVMRQTLDQINSQMMQQMLGAKLTPDQQQRVQIFSDKISTVVGDALSWEKLEPEYAKLYASAYTEQQLDDMIAFYKSPTGQVMVEKTPELANASVAIGQKRMADVLPEIQLLLHEFTEQSNSKAAPQGQ